MDIFEVQEFLNRMGFGNIITILLIIINVIVSYKGFRNEFFMEKYKFRVRDVLLQKDYKRLITSGFLHVNWTHLIFNMIVLFMFGGAIEGMFGSLPFLVIYMGSLVGGELLSLYIHRNHESFSSVGASSAICGIIFASIAVVPGMSIGFFLLPISFPGWLYGILYIAYCIYGIKSGKNNTAHDSHLGGGLAGVLLSLLFFPSALAENYIVILLLTVPTIAFIYAIVRYPHILLLNSFRSRKQRDFYSIDHKYNLDKAERQKELDRILEKISQKGMKSLSRAEKEKLKDYSQRV